MIRNKSVPKIAFRCVLLRIKCEIIRNHYSS